MDISPTALGIALVVLACLTLAAKGWEAARQLSRQLPPHDEDDDRRLR
jgi:hypothetical protein